MNRNKDINALRILQWNARSLHSNGDDLTHHLSKCNDLHHILCLQETWLQGDNVFNIPHYISLLKPRNSGIRGGCAIFIHKSITYEIVPSPPDDEYQQVNVFCKWYKDIDYKFL